VFLVSQLRVLTSSSSSFRTHIDVASASAIATEAVQSAFQLFDEDRDGLLSLHEFANWQSGDITAQAQRPPQRYVPPPPPPPPAARTGAVLAPVSVSSDAVLAEVTVGRVLVPPPPLPPPSMLAPSGVPLDSEEAWSVHDFRTLSGLDNCSADSVLARLIARSDGQGSVSVQDVVSTLTSLRVESPR
jgi:hypothetical protein